MRRLLALARIAGIATVADSVSWAQPRGVTLHQRRCVRAEVPGVLILPDATRWNAPEVRICFVHLV